MNIPAGLVAPETLSPREQQVYLGLACGYRAAEIAGAIGVGPKTISEYRARILDKLGLQDNADIVRHAYAPALRALTDAQLNAVTG